MLARKLGIFLTSGRAVIHTPDISASVALSCRPVQLNFHDSRTFVDSRVAPAAA